MKSFNEYFESKQLAEEKRERDIVENKRKVELEEETYPSGWGIFEGNQSAVDMYVDWITKRNK